MKRKTKKKKKNCPEISHGYKEGREKKRASVLKRLLKNSFSS
jgi:hypothetical protein